MASQAFSKLCERTRHRIEGACRLAASEPNCADHGYLASGIKLQPTTSNYPIIIKLFVDGTDTHELPAIKRNQTLQWERIPLW
jgi:hypothetical protein